MKFMVGIYNQHKRDGTLKFIAHTRGAWSFGLCRHEIDVQRESDAKRLAIAEHKERCMKEEQS